jgi:hypothetical protein
MVPSSAPTGPRRSWMRRLPPIAPLLRTPAVAATDGGRRATERAAGIERREARYATQPCHPEGIARSTCATAACRLRAGVPVSGRPPTLLDHGAMVRDLPSGSAHIPDVGASAPRASPSARRRSRATDPRAAGAGTGRGVGRREARDATNPAVRKYRPAHPCRGRAGCAAASW